MRISCLVHMLGAAVLVLPIACSGDSFSANPANSSAGGKSGNGGATAAGGASSGGKSNGGGGTTSTGGASAGGASAGGATSTGGGTGAGGGVVGVADAAPAHWCDTQHNALFCADFDEQAAILPLLESFTTYSQSGADFSLDVGGGVPSPPNALRVRTNANSSVKALVAQKIAPFKTPPNKLLLEFSLRIDAGSAVGILSGAAVVAIFTGADVSDGAIALEIGNGPTLVAAYLQPASTGLGFNTANLPGAFPQLNQWSGRYALEITYGTADASRVGCLQILQGGIRQLPKCLALPPSLSNPAFVSVALGVYSGGLNQTGDVQLRFDNVLLTAE